jgi:hypothetical protein
MGHNEAEIHVFSIAGLRFLCLLLNIWSEFSHGKGSVYSAPGADLVESRLPDSANVTST